MQYTDTVEAAKALNDKYNKLLEEISNHVYGQKEVISQVLTAIFSGGHCLLVGVPGLAKTLLVNTIAKVLDLKYKRIQFTPDLMPSDIIGSEILDQNKEFKFLKGPVFSNIILADEINRTPPKTQSALLEAMQEHTVTSSGKTFVLEEPFFVLATQNPIEQEGTYPLPEAQLDRFMFNVVLDYPDFNTELQIVKNTTQNYKPTVNKVMTADEIIYFRELIETVPVADNVVEYAVRLVGKTRPNGDFAPQITKDYVSWGAGPRASQYLIRACKTYALLNGKFSPDIEDVKAVAHTVLRHRIVLNYKAISANINIEKFISEIL